MHGINPQETKTNFKSIFPFKQATINTTTNTIYRPVFLVSPQNIPTRKNTIKKRGFFSILRSLSTTFIRSTVHQRKTIECMTSLTKEQYIIGNKGNRQTNNVTL